MASDETMSGPFCRLCSRAIPGGKVYAQRDRWSYVECPGCRLVFLYPAPDEAALSRYYNGDYRVDFQSHVQGARRRAERILKDLRERFPERGRLLEIGCSYGGFLEEARRDGWDVTGMELNEAASQFARERLGLRVLAGNLRDSLERCDETYDAVAMFHVIEHVPDPARLLELCRKRIRPGGLLVLKTPNVASVIARLAGASWQWISPPAHLYLFSPETLELLLRKTGFLPVTLQSAQGDANNNLFAFASSLAKRAFRRSSAESFGRLRRTLAVRIVEGACELAYFPFRLSIDPWLGGRLRQPELYAVASAT